MSKTYTVETHTVIHDDDTGSKITIRPDRDGLGLVEITSIDDGSVEASLLLRPQMAGLLAQALSCYAPPEEHPKA